MQMKVAPRDKCLGKFTRHFVLLKLCIWCLIIVWMSMWAASREFVSLSIPSWQILTAHAQPFRGARDLAFCLKVPLDSLLVWASSEGSGETARMRRLAWTFAARIGDKYQRTSMLMARVFPNYKNMIRIIWFCIVLTANTCSLHENQHYHVWSSMVYVKQAMTSTLLLALVAIVFTPNNVKTISIFIGILH